MPKAVQEGLRPGIPLLEYGELVDLDRSRKYGLSPILDPREIPVHPKVFGSPNVYTQEFAQQVWISVPDSVKRDIAVIEGKTGVPVPVEVTNVSISETQGDPTFREVERFGEFFVQANPKERSVWVEPEFTATAINLGLDKEHFYKTGVHLLKKGPIPIEKQRLYLTPPAKNTERGIITWYSHNVGMARLPLLLILRNYAIQFNNLGLQRLGVV